MLQPSQIETVVRRFPAEIAEVRGFLRSTGLAVETAPALRDVVLRLVEDRGFHRDLGSHVWMLLYGGATVPETLGVLAVATAGPRYAAAAAEEDAHALLRFVMESRNAMAGDSAARPHAPAAVMPNAAAVPVVEPVLRPQPVAAAPMPILEERIPVQRPTAVYSRAALRAITPAIAVEEPERSAEPDAEVKLPVRTAAATEEVQAGASRRGAYAAVAVLLLAGVGAGAWYARRVPDANEKTAQPAPIIEGTADVPASGTNAPAVVTAQPAPEAYVPETRTHAARPSAARPQSYASRPMLSGRTRQPDFPDGDSTPITTTTSNAPSRIGAGAESSAPAPVVRVVPPAFVRGTTPIIPSTTVPAKTAAAPVPNTVLAGRLGSPVVNQADAVDDRVAGAKGYPRLLRRKPLDANGTLVAKASPVNIPGGRTVVIPAGTVRSTALGITAGNLVYAPDPAYPAAAAVQHISGQVKLEASVDREGNVASARVISGPPMLRDAAVSAVQQWRYRPFTAGGKAQTFTATAVVDFQLQ